MNRRLIFTATLVAIAGTTAHAQQADRGAQNRPAVRKLFPVVTLFDRKPAAPTTPVAPNRPVEATGVAGDPFGTSAPDVARIRAMDVAGVRLGMSPDQARAALRASGYAPTPDWSLYTDGRPTVSRNYDYATFVEQARRGRLAAGGPMKSTNTIVSEDWNKGDERVHVAYVPLREGVQVADVLYVIPEGRIDWVGIRSNVTAKYGRPTRLSEDLRTVRYCGDGACAAVSANFAELSLRGSWSVQLEDGGALERMSREQAAADADRAIRKTAKPSF